MIAAVFWSALATVTLLIGMVLAYRNLVGLKWTGLIMACGAGALTFYFADRWVDHLGGADRMDFDGAQAGGSGMGILLGSLQIGVKDG